MIKELHIDSSWYGFLDKLYIGDDPTDGLATVIYKYPKHHKKWKIWLYFLTFGFAYNNPHLWVYKIRWKEPNCG